MPSRSQYGSPTNRSAVETIAATRQMSSSWARTNAPSLRSIRSHVSRTFFRRGRGQEARHDVDRAIALEEPVGRGGEGEEDADEDRKRLPADGDRRVDRARLPWAARGGAARARRAPCPGTSCRCALSRLWTVPIAWPDLGRAFAAPRTRGQTRPDRRLRSSGSATPTGRGMRRRAIDSTPGRIAAAIVNATKSSAISSFSFQRASASTMTVRAASVVRNARRNTARSFMAR